MSHREFSIRNSSSRSVQFHIHRFCCIFSFLLQDFANLPEDQLPGKLQSSDLAVAKISVDMGQGRSISSSEASFLNSWPCWGQNGRCWQLPRRNPVEKALFYEKGKGGCHLVSPHKLKKICPAIIQVSDTEFSYRCQIQSSHTGVG